MTTPDINTLLAKLNQYTGTSSNSLTDAELAYLRQQLTAKKKYGLIWEDKPEAVEQQLLTGLPVLTELPERLVLNNAPASTGANAQLSLAFAPENGLPHNPGLKSGAIGEAAPAASSIAPDFSPGNTITNHTLIEGDNLHALTVLNYTHAGAVDVIYIDPPYNTGNKDFKYNDSFVDREDAYRHSKWLSFMAKRLRLAKTLLRDTGVIFISIDDNEQAQLKLLCDEVFGEENFVANVIWEKSYAPKSSAMYFSDRHEYIAVYTAQKGQWQINPLPRTEKQNKVYKNPDNDPRGLWRANNLAARNFYSLGTYSITTPSGRVVEGPPKGSYWRYSEKKFKELDADGRIWWGVDGNNVPAPKIFLSEVAQGITPETFLPYTEVGHSQEGKKEILDILHDAEVFTTPKPVRLLQRIIGYHTSPNALVLDFFAGSGTTLHAVMALNAEDGGNRRCILVTNNENNIAEEVCYERNRRVIEGYVNSKGVAVPGLSGNALRYYRTALVGRQKTLANKRALMRQATDLLCLKEGCYSPLTPKGGISPAAATDAAALPPVGVRGLQVFSDPATNRAMLLVYDPDAIDEAVALIGQLPPTPRIKVYVFAPASYPFTDEFEAVADRVDLCALPDAMYQAFEQVWHTLIPTTPADQTPL